MFRYNIISACSLYYFILFLSTYIFSSSPIIHVHSYALQNTRHRPQNYKLDHFDNTTDGICYNFREQLTICESSDVNCEKWCQNCDTCASTLNGWKNTQVWNATTLLRHSNRKMAYHLASNEAKISHYNRWTYLTPLGTVGANRTLHKDWEYCEGDNRDLLTDKDGSFNAMVTMREKVLLEKMHIWTKYKVSKAQKEIERAKNKDSVSGKNSPNLPPHRTRKHKRDNKLVIQIIFDMISAHDSYRALSFCMEFLARIGATIFDNFNVVGMNSPINQYPMAYGVPFPLAQNMAAKNKTIVNIKAINSPWLDEKTHVTRCQINQGWE